MDVECFLISECSLKDPSDSNYPFLRGRNRVVVVGGVSLDKSGRLAAFR